MLSSFIRFCFLFLFLFACFILFDKLVYKIKQNRYTAKKDLEEVKKGSSKDNPKDYVHDHKKKGKK